LNIRCNLTSLNAVPFPFDEFVGVSLAVVVNVSLPFADFSSSAVANFVSLSLVDFVSLPFVGLVSLSVVDFVSSPGSDFVLLSSDGLVSLLVDNVVPSPTGVSDDGSAVADSSAALNFYFKSTIVNQQPIIILYFCKIEMTQSNVGHGVLICTINFP
jgi:hypothetical protein